MQFKETAEMISEIIKNVPALNDDQRDALKKAVKLIKDLAGNQ